MVEHIYLLLWIGCRDFSDFIQLGLENGNHFCYYNSTLLFEVKTIENRLWYAYQANF